MNEEDHIPTKAQANIQLYLSFIIVEAGQLRELEESARLAEATTKAAVNAADGRCGITFSLARKGVTLVELEWP